MTKAREKKVKKDEPTPSLIATLSEPGNLDAIAGLACRLGSPPFDVLTGKEAIAELHRLWPLYDKTATERCIERYHPGTRPALWWIYDSPAHRRRVKPRDWNDPNDGARYAKERAEADLAFLVRHKLLTKEEKIALEESKKEKHFEPEPEEENSNEDN